MCVPWCGEWTVDGECTCLVAVGRCKPPGGHSLGSQTGWPSRTANTSSPTKSIYLHHRGANCRPAHPINSASSVLPLNRAPCTLFLKLLHNKYAVCHNMVSQEDGQMADYQTLQQSNNVMFCLSFTLTILLPDWLRYMM